MTADEQAILDQLNADQHAVLYRCRWSAPDAKVVVPQLTALLSSKEGEIVDEALRALFRIGTPAEHAACEVAALVDSPAPITRRLAVQTLGQIAHHKPELCVQPVAAALSDEWCCRDAMRVLAFIGTPAHGALRDVARLYTSRDAKVRKAAIVTAAAIGAARKETVELLNNALHDHSKIVREAAKRAAGQIGGA